MTISRCTFSTFSGNGFLHTIKEKGCWYRAGFRAVCTLGGAAASIATTAIAAHALILSAPYISEWIGDSLVLFGPLSFAPTVKASKLALISIPGGAIIGYVFADLLLD